MWDGIRKSKTWLYSVNFVRGFVWPDFYWVFLDSYNV